MKRIYLSCVALVCGQIVECSGISDARKEVEFLYDKYNINRDVTHPNVATNHVSSAFFDFEIPQKRQFYCATIMSNIVIVTLHDRNGISKVSADGIDVELIKSFQQKLLTYKYKPLSVTSGPKYVYVTICSVQNQSYKFDYPWWISSRHSDIPSGMLLGLNASDSELLLNYAKIFGRYIFPNMMKLQGKHHSASKTHQGE